MNRGSLASVTVISLLHKGRRHASNVLKEHQIFVDLFLARPYYTYTVVHSSSYQLSSVGIVRAIDVESG